MGTMSAPIRFLLACMLCLTVSPVLDARGLPQAGGGPEARTAATGMERGSALRPAHRANLVVHVVAGSLAIVVGTGLLLAAKGTARHRRRGRLFVVATATVVGSAVVGLLAFRALPTFAALSLLVGYQLLGGWRVARTQAAGPGPWDALATLGAGALAVMLVIPMYARPADVLMLSSLGALSLVLLWDTVRWVFPRRWHAGLWRYEHGYKSMAALFGMLSALVGNVVRIAQPWSQLVPVALGLLVIAIVLLRIPRASVRETSLARV